MVAHLLSVTFYVTFVKGNKVCDVSPSYATDSSESLSLIDILDCVAR